ncbi:MAG: fimbria/pilus periplasmic chaperone [Fusobacteriaceae bacterium]
MKKIVLLVSLLTSIVSYSFNLSISPTGFILPLDRPQNKEVTLTNNSTESMRVEIVVEQPSDYKAEHSMNTNVKIYPKVLTMPGNSTKVIRFSAKLPTEYKDGQYKALIVFKEIPDNPTMVAQQQGDISVNMAMYSEVAIPLYGEKGKLIFEGKVRELNAKRVGEGITIVAKVSGEGNTTIRPDYKVDYLDMSGKKLGEASGTFPRTLRDADVELKAELLNPPSNAKALLIKITDTKGKTLIEKKQSI